MRGNWRRDDGDVDSDSEYGAEARTDGSNARVFSQAIAHPGAGGGFIPRHKEPPGYIRTKSRHKKIREFNRMFLAQELVATSRPNSGDAQGNTGEQKEKPEVPSVGGGNKGAANPGGAIWSTEFSKDGKYLAAAGRGKVVRVWAVLATPEERRAHEEEESANGSTGERLSAPVFRERPFREFHGHTGEVLDLSWSKNNFLLSSSMDKTVRLWHISRDDCLCTFKHKDLIPRLAFHPLDDRFFLAGSLDTTLRLWSIPDKAVVYSAQLPDLITAVAFSPDGKTAIAGLLNGLCLFYDTDGLKQQAQIHVRSSRGKNAKGSKITGIQTVVASPSGPLTSCQGRTLGAPPSSPNTSTHAPDASEVKVLISSNDSRIRIYNLRDKTLEFKLKGHENAYSQIAATCSDDGRYIICGSEDRKTFIWDATVADSENKDKPPYESFNAHGDIVTTAIFAPTASRMLLSASGDPIYDLCNPPPVTLMSLEEAASGNASQVCLSTDGDCPITVSEPVTSTNPPGSARKPEESPAYIARSKHFDGNIIVTADDVGVIKVFRQDCAFVKRKHESWETGSTFSKKLGTHSSGFISGNLRRSGSIVTRTTTSSAPHSRRGSVSQPAAAGLTSSPQHGPANPNSDRILSWRQDVVEPGTEKHGTLSVSNGTPTRSERSLSPNKPSRTSTNASLATPPVGDGKMHPNPKHSATFQQDNRPSTGASVHSNTTTDSKPSKSNMNKEEQHKEDASRPPAPGFSLRSANDDTPPKSDSTGAGYSFWNLNRWRNTGPSRNQGTPGAVGSLQGQTGSNHAHSPLSTVTKAESRDSEDDGKQEKDSTKQKNKARRISLGSTTLMKHSRSASDGASVASSRRKSLPPSSLAHQLGDTPGISERRVRFPNGEAQSGGDGPAGKTGTDSGSETNTDDNETEMRCRKCGGREFTAKHTGTRARLICGTCAQPIK